MSTLAIKDLSVSYGQRKVLDNLSLSCESGEFLGIIGSNGAGKTTLLRSILGLVKAQSGTITIDGKNPAAARGSVGYVPQKHLFAWDFPLTIKDTVMTGRIRHTGWFARPTTQDWVAVFSALERVDLTDLAERPIAELSGGQRQRVLLAKALAAEPRLLLLDEPFTGVDAPTQTLLNTLYMELAQEGLTILMSTHDVFSALDACTRIIGVRGDIALDGATESFTAHQLHNWLVHRSPQGTHL